VWFNRWTNQTHRLLKQFAGGPPEIAVVIPGAYFSLETSKLFLSGPEGVSDPKKIRGAVANNSNNAK
jgi:hypothetical protein